MKFLADSLLPSMALVLLWSVWVIGSANVAREKASHLVLSPADPTLLPRILENCRKAHTPTTAASLSKI